MKNSLLKISWSEAVEIWSTTVARADASAISATPKVENLAVGMAFGEEPKKAAETTVLPQATKAARLMAPPRRGAFTIAEIMIATAVGCTVGGAVMILMLQTSTEQRNAYSNMTIEENAYQLQANVTGCMRSMSATLGMTPNYASGLLDGNGNLLGYQSVFVFYPTNGGYITGNISYQSATGQVIYTPNLLYPSTQTLWMSNTTSTILTQFCFSTSYNLDGSQNSSLVNVQFQLNDNGYSRHSAANNPAYIFRNFSVQMRNDN